MEYIYMDPPFEHCKFDLFSKKQASEYFEWYTKQSFLRINLLQEYINTTTIEKVELDFSDYSLIPLWEWYENFVLLNDEINTKTVSIDNGEPLFSNEVLKIALDVSFYFAELFIKHNSSVKWGYFTKPKNRISVNKPVLLGFKYDKCLDPRLIVENCSYRSLKVKNSDALYDIYNNWLVFLK